jgi:D-glycero-D-manno-heptose 1,7-bisphosphate phosphatase
MTSKAILLDRDGTLIDVVRDHERGVITTAFHPNQLRLLPGVEQALRQANQAGFLLAIVTNQPGPAKGHFPTSAVEQTNQALLADLRARGISVAGVEACMHHPQGSEYGDPSLIKVCDCRKPAPGMLLRWQVRLGLNVQRSWMVGDSVDDIEAGKRAGMQTGLVFSRQRCELCPLRYGPSVKADQIGNNLAQVIAEIVASDSQ